MVPYNSHKTIKLLSWFVKFILIVTLLNVSEIILFKIKNEFLRYVQLHWIVPVLHTLKMGKRNFALFVPQTRSLRKNVGSWRIKKNLLYGEQFFWVWKKNKKVLDRFLDHGIPISETKIDLRTFIYSEKII